MPLRFGGSSALSIVSATTFGAAATTDARAVIACVVSPGVLHTPNRDDTRRELRLVVLAQDGRDSEQQGGAAGQGIWFGAGVNNTWFAIGASKAGGAFVHHWTLPASGSGNWPVEVNERVVNASLLNGRFAAGVGPLGALYIVADARQPTVFVVSSHGQRETFPLAPSTPPAPQPSRLAQDVRRLVFQFDRMFVVCVGSRLPRESGPRAIIRAFSVGANHSVNDTTWGNAGVWTAPADFSPVDLLSSSKGELLCVGWTAVRATFALTVIRIAADGRSETTTSGPPLPNTFPIRTAIDAHHGQLIAASVPNPIPFAPSGGAEWALVSRRSADDVPDRSFGNQGACWAQFPGYPLAVREVVPTAHGFFLVCDRPVGIQRDNIQPVVYAYEPTGHRIPGFGETGIVHHEELPTMFQLHEATRTVAAGWRRISNPNPFGPDAFELAVTTLGASGNVSWRYGTAHGMSSAPLIIPGHDVGAVGINAVTSWGAFIAVGGWYAGPTGGGGFVTFRDQNGQPLPGGQGTLTFANSILRLEPAANSTLEATSQVPGAFAEKRIIRPDLTVDPSAPVPVPPPVTGLSLADGSRLSSEVSVVAGAFPLIRLWLSRVLPNGFLDPLFGGRSTSTPAPGTSIDRSSFDGTTVTHVAAFGPFIHPAGGYLGGIVAERLFPNDTLPTPLGLLVTRWNDDGWPMTGWGNGGTVEHVGIAVINQVLADDPAGLLLVGAVRPLRTDDRVPTLWRIRYSDGQLDPTFGNQGVLSVSLRHNENRMALPIRVRADGTRFVPIITPETSPFTPEDLIWIEIS